MLAPFRRANSAASIATTYKVFNYKNSMVGEIPRATLASCAAGADDLARPLGLVAARMCQEGACPLAPADGKLRNFGRSHDEIHNVAAGSRS